MKYLYKVFYESDHSDFSYEYERRFSFDSAVQLNLNIKPMDQPNTFKLYYIPTNTMIDKISKIHLLSNKLNDIFNTKLSSVAREKFISELVIEELYNTNKLEGVSSTKEEIARSVRDVRYKIKDKKRFTNMIRSYLSLINGNFTLPKLPSDIRTIYDEITKNEIAKNELPDGNIFRNDITYVLKKSGSGKIIHRGLTPEKTIIYETERLLAFLNDGADGLPTLLKVAIGHYYFGYIHPFYDGNGRTSRFISSMYLSNILGPIAALSLSQGCNRFTKEYLESFEMTNSIMNRGEMNLFIETFLYIIVEALKKMYMELKEKAELLEIALQKITNDPILEGNNTQRQDLMFILAQNYFFQFSEGLTVKEISDGLDLSTTTVRKILNELNELSLIEQKGKRPIYYTINPQYLEEN